jgi:hypothetical protein
VGDFSSRPRQEFAAEWDLVEHADSMGTLGFLSADLFACLLEFLEMEDACRLSMLNRFFHVRPPPYPTHHTNLFLATDACS